MRRNAHTRLPAKSGAIGSYAARHVWLHRRARAFDARLSNGSPPMLSASIDVRGQAVRGHQIVASRGAQSRAVPSPEKPHPPLPRRARPGPRTAGDDCLLLAAHVEVLMATLTPRPWRAALYALRGRGIAAHHGAAALPRRQPQPNDLRGAANRARQPTREAGGSAGRAGRRPTGRAGRRLVASPGR